MVILVSTHNIRIIIHVTYFCLFTVMCSMIRTYKVYHILVRICSAQPACALVSNNPAHVIAAARAFFCHASCIGGDYDVTIPCEIAAGDYKIRVGRFEDPALYDCSDAFSIVADASGDDESSDDGSGDDESSDSESSDDGSGDDESMSYHF